jgi:hypothetical protein
VQAAVALVLLIATHHLAAQEGPVAVAMVEAQPLSMVLLEL